MTNKQAGLDWYWKTPRREETASKNLKKKDYGMTEETRDVLSINPYKI
jgi:hypothetical protein